MSPHEAVCSNGASDCGSEGQWFETTQPYHRASHAGRTSPAADAARKGERGARNDAAVQGANRSADGTSPVRHSAGPRYRCDCMKFASSTRVEMLSLP